MFSNDLTIWRLWRYTLNIYFVSIHFATELDKVSTKGQNIFILNVYIFTLKI